MLKAGSLKMFQTICLLFAMAINFTDIKELPVKGLDWMMKKTNPAQQSRISDSSQSGSR